MCTDFSACEAFSVRRGTGDVFKPVSVRVNAVTLDIKLEISL